MPNTLTFKRTATANGQSWSADESVSYEFGIPFAATIPAAKTGTLSTRTDNDTGVIAAATGHGIISTDVVDVFWSGGQRQGMTATVSGDNITVDGGTGDNLPVATTAVTLSKRTSNDLVVTGNNVVGIIFQAPADAQAVFSLWTSGAEQLVVGLPAGKSYVWVSSSYGATNPIAGDAIVTVRCSQSASAAAKDCTGIVCYN